MRLFFIFCLLAISCSKNFEVRQAQSMQDMQCELKENCLSSMQMGDNYILPLKMKGEDALQNIGNIQKIAAKIGNYNPQNKGLLLILNKDKLQIEFMADKENRVIHVRSQIKSIGVLGSKKGLSEIEEIRFKFNQNDF